MFGTLEKWFSKQKYCEKEKMQERGSLWIETMEEKGRKERNEQKKKMKKEKGRPKISPSPPPPISFPFFNAEPTQVWLSWLSQLSQTWVNSPKKKNREKKERKERNFFLRFSKKINGSNFKRKFQISKKNKDKFSRILKN